MKAVAALRNQFGGHAVRKALSPRPVVIVSHLSLIDFRNYESAEVDLARGAEPLRRQQRAGQDESRRGDRLPEHPGIAPGLDRPGADPHRGRGRDHAGPTRTRRPCRAGRGAAEPLRREPRPGQSRAGQAARAAAVHRDRAVRPRGSCAGAGRALRAPSIPRPAAGAAHPAPGRRARRLRPGAAPAQHAAEVGARRHALPERQLSTLEIWDERLVDLGSEIIEARRTSSTRLRPHVAAAYAAIAGADHAADLAGELSISGAQPDEDSDRATRPFVRTEVSAADAVAAVPRRAGPGPARRAGPRPHPGRPAPRRSAARAERTAGPRLREPRRILVVRPCAQAGLGRSCSAPNRRSGDPVVILDDVFAELDEARRGRLAAAIGGLRAGADHGRGRSATCRRSSRTHRIRIDGGRIVGVEDVMSEDRPDAEPEHIAVYRRIRSVFGERAASQSRDARRRKRTARRRDERRPTGSGRDPRGLGECSARSPRPWAGTRRSRSAELLAAWAGIVGARDRRRTPIRSGIEEGVLSVRCDSTAWAQQLRLMRDQVLAAIAERVPGGAASSRCASWGRTPPPGNAAPEQFQAAVLAILTAEKANQVGGATKSPQTADFAVLRVPLR